VTTFAAEVDVGPERVAFALLDDAPPAELTPRKRRLELKAREKVTESARERRDDVATPQMTRTRRRPQVA